MFEMQAVQYQPNKPQDYTARKSVLPALPKNSPEVDLSAIGVSMMALNHPAKANLEFAMRAILLDPEISKLHAREDFRFKIVSDPQAQDATASMIFESKTYELKLPRSAFDSKPLLIQYLLFGMHNYASQLSRKSPLSLDQAKLKVSMKTIADKLAESPAQVERDIGSRLRTAR